MSFLGIDRATIASTSPLEFETKSIVELVDSPLIAGRYYRDVKIHTAEFPLTIMHFVSESPAGLDFDDSQVAKYERLMAESAALFQGAPFSQYDVRIGEEMGGSPSP